MAKLALQEQLQKKILILDGAMGTMIQQENLTEADFGGEELDGCNEMLVLTRPDVISKIHEPILPQVLISLKPILSERQA